MTPEILIALTALLILVASGWLIVFALRWRRYRRWLAQDAKDAEFLRHVAEVCGGHPIKLQPPAMAAIERTVKELKEKANVK